MRNIVSPLDGIRSPFGRPISGSTPPITPEIEILTRSGDTILTRDGSTVIARAS